MNATVTHLNNQETVMHRVAMVIKDLPPGHTRKEAFKLINDAGIIDNKGKPVSASMYYHQICMVQRADGRAYIKKLNPNFVPTESPYARDPKEPRKIVTTGMKISKKSATKLFAHLEELQTNLDGLRGIMQTYLNGSEEEQDNHTEETASPVTQAPVPAPTLVVVAEPEKQAEIVPTAAPKKVANGHNKKHGNSAHKNSNRMRRSA